MTGHNTHSSGRKTTAAEFCRWVAEMEISRTWVMPSIWTFSMKPVQTLFEKYQAGAGWADPFVGENSPAEFAVVCTAFQHYPGEWIIPFRWLALPLAAYANRQPDPPHGGFLFGVEYSKQKGDSRDNSSRPTQTAYNLVGVFCGVDWRRFVLGYSTDDRWDNFVPTGRLVAKKHSSRPASSVRERAPLYKNADGNVQILCPYCQPTHPIYPDKISACGTFLKVTASQTVYLSRTIRKAEVVCVRCGKGSGEMVRYGKGFVHVENCNPERRLLAEPPIYSEWARRVYNMPKMLRECFQWIIRKPIVEVNEVDETGKETGKVLGYYFGESRGRSIHHQREHPSTDPG